MVLKQFGNNVSPTIVIKLVYKKQFFKRFIQWFGFQAVEYMQS